MTNEESKTWIDIIDESRFWIEGITTPFIGMIGFIGNVLVIVVLLCLIQITDNVNQRNFDITLTALAIVDTLLLFVYITDSFLQNSYSSNNSTEVFTEPVWYQVR